MPDAVGSEPDSSRSFRPPGAKTSRCGKRNSRLKADTLRSDAERDTKQLRAATQHEVAEQKATAEREVATLRATAEREITQLRAKAAREAEEKRAEATAEALRRFGDRDEFRDYSDRRAAKNARRAAVRSP